MNKAIDYDGLFFLMHVALMFASNIFFIPWLIFKKKLLKLSGYILFILSLIFLSASLLIRIAESQRLPLASMYEFGSLVILFIIVIAIAVDLKLKQYSFTAVTAPVVFLLGGVIFLFYKESGPLMPALKSGWLTFHVITAVISYSLISLSFVTAVFSLILDKYRSNKELPPSALLEYMTDRFITLSFPFLTLLIITGAVWAEYAWGRFWSWDPKETWALITWLVYLIYLHGTRMRGWRGRKIIYFAIFGFFVVMFTFFGVNLLLSGLHSYN